jgi:hypothetical protein
MKYLILLIAFLAACGPTYDPIPPDQVSIDPSFSSGQRTAIRDTLDAWCGAVGWCPEEVDWSIDLSRGRFINDFKFSKLGRENNVFAVNQWDHIHFNPNHANFNDLTEFWIVSAHEEGHWGIGEQHLTTGIMVEERDAGTLPMEIDRAAVKAWQTVQQAL